MEYRFCKILFLCLTLLGFKIMEQVCANETDSLKNSLSTEKILLLKSSWEASENAAGLHFFNIPKRLGKTSVNFNFENGDYHLFQQEEEKNAIGFYTNGYSKLNNWNFYGNFSYFNQKNRGQKWSDRFESDRDNPYTLGDKIGGTYNKEYFKMCGKAACKINNLLSFGFDVKYRAGVAARRKDPRPANKITDIDLMPGIIFNFKEIKVGANFRYEGANEEIDLSTVTDSIYNIFHVKGLGAFSSTTELDGQSCESDLFGGGLQFHFQEKRVTNLTEINFHKKSTDIKRGENHPLQVVLLEKFNTSLSSTFLFTPFEKTVKKLSVKYTDKRLFGHEPVVEPKLEQVNYQWATVEKYTVFWHSQQEIGLDYSFYKLKNANAFDWGTQLSAKVSTSESTYYFVPEFNKQQLNYFSLNALFEKEVQGRTFDFVFSAGSGLQKGFNNSLEIITDETLLKNVNVDFATHNFNYFNQRLLTLEGTLLVGKRVNFYSSPAQLFLSATCKHLFSAMHDNRNRAILNINFGVNF